MKEKEVLESLSKEELVDLILEYSVLWSHRVGQVFGKLS